MGPGHHVWWFHVSSSHTLGFSDMSSTINKTNLGLSENVWKSQKCEWLVINFPVENCHPVVDLWLVEMQKRYKSAIFEWDFTFFQFFLWSCRNHVRTVVSYPYHMIYIYNIYIYPHATSLDSLSPVCLAGRKTGLILLIFTGNRRFPVNVPIQS